MKCFDDNVARQFLPHQTCRCFWQVNVCYPRILWGVSHSLLLASVLAIGPVTCGCGTVSARAKGPGGPYSGVGYDFEKLSSGDEWSDFSVMGQAGSIPFLAPRGLLWLLDIPLSLVGDTVMLPVEAFQQDHPTEKR